MTDTLNVGDKIIFGDENVFICNNDGVLELENNPTTTMGIATKSYVDNAISNHAFVGEPKNVPKCLAPTGTINTGASGHLVLGTALPTTFSSGVWIYLPTIATTPAITAGFYYAIATNTTTLTLYDNDTADKEPYDFTVGSVYTGTTAEVTMHSDTLEGGSMGSNGTLIANTFISHSASVNAKTYKLKLNTTLMNTATTTSATTYLYYGVCRIQNLNSESKQISNRNFAIGGANPFRGTVNTATDQTVTLTMQKADATEYLIVECYSLEHITI